MQEISDRVRVQCRLIAEQARVVTGSPRANLLLYDESRRRLVTVATTGADVPLQQIALDLIRRNHPGLDPLDLSHRPTANATVAAAFIGQQTQVNTMAEAFENILPPSAVALAHGLVGITNVVSCPVAAEGRALGLIRFLVSSPPSDSQLALFDAAASQIGLTLANAELADQTRRQLAATQAIAEVARLGASEGVDVTLRALVERVREVTGADAALVYLVDPGGDTFAPAAESLADANMAADVSRLETPARQVGAGLVGWVIASGEAAFVPDVRVDPRDRSPRTDRAPEASIVVPMLSQRRVIGCLRIGRFGRRRFTEADLWLAQILADEAALVVQIAQDEERAQTAARTAGALAIAAAAIADIADPVEAFLLATDDLLQRQTTDSITVDQLESLRMAARRIADGMAGLRAAVEPPSSPVAPPLPDPLPFAGGSGSGERASRNESSRGG